MSPSQTASLPFHARIKHIPSPYSPLQIFQWLSAIGYVHNLTEGEIANGTFPKNAGTLRKLSRLHFLRFPFETSAMHYQEDHFVDVSPQAVFQRLVIDRKGSYCYGLNGLLLGMLRGLGFRVYGGSARVNANISATEPEFQALTHMVLLAQPCPADEYFTYLVDVGFGGSGLSRPIALLPDDDSNIVLGTTPSERHRLVQKVLPNSSIEVQNLSDHPEMEYQLEVSHSGGDGQWKPIYTFSTRESFQWDYDAASFDVCTRPSIPFFWDGICVVKHFILNEAEIEEVRAQVGAHHPASSVNGISCACDHENGDVEYLGKLTMSGREVRKHVGSRSEVIRRLETELERLQTLREVFGVDLKDEDARHIRGRSAALASQ